MAAYTDVKPLMTDTITASISQLLLWTRAAGSPRAGVSGSTHLAAWHGEGAQPEPAALGAAGEGPRRTRPPFPH